MILLNLEVFIHLKCLSRVNLKEITELSGVKKQAGAELYPKLSKKFKKVRKKSEKHQIFRKLAADTSADDLASINVRLIWGGSNHPWQKIPQECCWGCDKI